MIDLCLKTWSKLISKHISGISVFSAITVRQPRTFSLFLVSQSEISCWLFRRSLRPFRSRHTVRSYYKPFFNFVISQFEQVLISSIILNSTRYVEYFFAEKFLEFTFSENTVGVISLQCNSMELMAETRTSSCLTSVQYNEL